MITTLKELEQLDNKYNFVGITCLPPLLNTDNWIGFMVIDLKVLNDSKTQWLGYRIAWNLYEYLTIKHKYKFIELPETQYE